ncbi:nicotinate phosphoribosyltransferase [Alligator sinensis]|uniref:nicotinate phosphoribosyltransferase n=1 Tax=Alligator sinensis TaxID=38654 RepID=A0A3Q0HDH3_ALLSI|nr:nicotinate phosphoribosyltransferase [Alligator sinensis]
MGSLAGGLQLPGALAAGPSCRWLRAATWHSSWSPASQVGGCRMEPGQRSRLALLTDLYQFTMAYGYWRAGRHWEPAEFELSFRRCPFQGGFALGAGLGECLAFLRGFSLSQADIEYVRSALPSGTDEAFFDYLRTVDASEVTVAAVPEGSVVFPRVPLLQVKGPLLVVQLLESTLLWLLNYASLVATNAARFRLLAGPDKKLMEMGLRRAQGPDGALSASKYSYVGGFDFTSNVLAGQLYGIPVRGTVAHSYITSFSALAEVQPRVSAWQGPPQPATRDRSCGSLEQPRQVYEGCTMSPADAGAPGRRRAGGLPVPRRDVAGAGLPAAPRAPGGGERGRAGGVRVLRHHLPLQLPGAGGHLLCHEVCEPLPSLPEVRSHAEASLRSLGPAHKRLREPEPYQVATTEKLHVLLQTLRQASQ